MAWWKRWLPGHTEDSLEVDPIRRPVVLGVDEIALEGGLVRLGSESFPLSEVFVASVNRHPVLRDGIGGSFVLRRRYVGKDGAAESATCRGTFSTDAWPVVERMIAGIERHGGVVTRAEVLDSAFRKAFF